jgi:hypothetical protein
MTSTTDTLQNSQAASEMTPLRGKVGLDRRHRRGLCDADLFALGSVLMATVASVLVFGVAMIVAGVAEVISAFQIKSWGKFQRLYPRFVPGNRSHHGRRGLDRDWLRLTPQSGVVTAGIAGLIVLPRWFSPRARQLLERLRLSEEENPCAGSISP